MLDSRVRRMMENLRSEVEEVDGSVGAKFQSLDLDGDGVLSREELMIAIEAMNEKRRPDAKQIKQVRTRRRWRRGVDGRRGIGRDPL
jgi:Ca2+-binding EF-hand superfamily protein